MKLHYCIFFNIFHVSNLTFEMNFQFRKHEKSEYEGFRTCTILRLTKQKKKTLKKRIEISFIFFLISSCLDFITFYISYRTLHSYNLIWAVCHLFSQQRWRTHTYSVSGNHWPGEPRDMRKTTFARKFRLAIFGAISKTRIFYKYVVFKHSFSFSQFPFATATHSLQYDSTDVKKQQHGWASQTFIPSLYIDYETFSRLGETDCFEPQKEIDILDM